MSEFDSKVSEEIGYYVYALVDPRTQKPFYIGKGKDNRVFAHISDAECTETETRKLDKIREITDLGFSVEHIILRHGLTEPESYIVESTVIDTLRYSGINLTNAVLGHHTSAYGLMTVDEIKRKYTAAPLDKIEQGCVIININKSYDKAKKNKSFYEATRGTWVMNEKKAKSLRYALAEYRGFIVEVYEIDSSSWEVLDGRMKFSGKVATDEVRSLYLNKRVTKKKGSANPIRYKA